MTGTARRPEAVVLVASPKLERQLGRLREKGWAGPVVVVGDHEEAAEVASAMRSTLHQGSGPVPGEARPAVAAPDPGQPQLMLDPDRRLAVSGTGRVHLTPLEYGMVRALLVQQGRVCHFADLTEQIWGTRFLGDTTQVHSVVKRVRRKLDEIASPVQVQAVHGVGFRAVVRQRPEEARHDRVTGE